MIQMPFRLNEALGRWILAWSRDRTKSVTIHNHNLRVKVNKIYSIKDSSLTVSIRTYKMKTKLQTKFFTRSQMCWGAITWTILYASWTNCMWTLWTTAYKAVFPELPFKQKMRFKILMTASITTYASISYQLCKKQQTFSIEQNT
jgi:hypothetical protein